MAEGANFFIAGESAGIPFPAAPTHTHSPFVLDISSDEESGGGGLITEDPKFTGSDDYDWLADLLQDGKTDDTSDDVVVVKEVNAKFKPRPPVSVSLADDDDCVILDGDPDKAASAAASQSHGSADDDASSDDLQFVGEKGQVACRDYPHSRHLCVKFPFSSTPHEKHCVLCHCYVCDMPAPCTYWLSGMVSTDHCHATDKEEFWRVCRKQFKREKISPAPNLKSFNCYIPVSQCTPVPLPLGPTSIVATSMPNNSGRILNPCSTRTSTIFSTGNVATACDARLQSDYRMRHLIRFNGGSGQRPLTYKNGCQLAPRSVVSDTTFKRVGMARTSFSVNSSNQRADLQHAGSALPNILDSVGVQANLNRSHSMPSSVRSVPNFDRSSTLPSQPRNVSSDYGTWPLWNNGQIYEQSSALPVAADASHGWSNDLGQNFQEPLPAQAFSGNGQFQVCQPLIPNQTDSQLAGTVGLTEIENWLLEDLPCEDINSLSDNVPNVENNVGNLLYTGTI